ncbi:MAG: GGDEF domain-containing protein [Oscillospiraceae bacterium]|nr:GGDEF domain-containing protein [Oscillospiraceae bacterium]
MEKNENGNDSRYYYLLEQLLLIMTKVKGFRLRELYDVLGELCRMFRISKGTVQFFQGLNHEMEDRGETFVCYDSGEGGEPVITVRIVTKVNAVVTGSVTMPDGAEPLSPEEYARVDLIIKTVLSFVSRVRLQSVVEMLSFHDEKGFPNTRCLMQYLQKTNEDKALGGKAALHFNLRHFSLVNQEFGEQAGDIAMRSFYEELKELTGREGAVCRLGGDNFVAVCGQERLAEVLDFLKGTPVHYDTVTGRRVKVSASTGVYLIPADFIMQNPGEIMDKIIAASRAARSGVKERVVYYDDALQARRERFMRIQQRFPEALRNEEYHVYYQPKIDLQTGTLAGAEALCRWVRGEEIIAPNDFIPTLEMSTEICKLDFYMLDHVCRDIRRWLDEGRDVVRISVNLSRRHIMDFDLLQNIIEIIDKHAVPHQYIEIELTETTTDVEFRALKRLVTGLQAAGIFASVDDFGVGYSSLNLIREIPWNVLKIDRSFLPDKQDEPDSSRSVMFRYVTAMAKELGLACIAEGVETQSQVELLQESNCVLAQGYFFDRPLQTAEFEERLSGRCYQIV